MAGKGATVSTFESLIANGDQGWDVPVPCVRARDVVLVAVAWAALVAFILFPAFQIAALGATALLASAIDAARKKEALRVSLAAASCHGMARHPEQIVAPDFRS